MGTNIPTHLSIKIVADLPNYCKGQSQCQSDDDFLPSNVDAVCWSNNGRGERVEIRQSKWDEMSKLDQWSERDSKEQLIYHELGHCVLNKEHIFGNKRVEDNICPGSIMNPYTFSEQQINDCYMLDHLINT